MADPENPQGDEALVQNAADQEQVKEGRKKEKERRRQELADIKELLELPAGQRFLWSWLDRLRLFKSSVESGDPYETALNEGRRDVGNELVGDIEAAAPGALYRLMEAVKQPKKKEPS